MTCTSTAFIALELIALAVPGLTAFAAAQPTIPHRSVTVSNLPVNGSMIYMR